MAGGERHKDPGDEVEILRAAFGEAVRKLGVAHDAAESVRARAAAVLAGTTAVAAFLGGAALDRTPEGAEWALAVLGLVSYLLSVALSLRVVVPKKDWDVGQDTAKLAHAAGGESARRTYGRLAIRYQASFEITSDRVGAMCDDLRHAVWSMAVEVMFFACLLAATATSGQATRVEPTTATTAPPIATTTTVAAPTTVTRP